MVRGGGVSAAGVWNKTTTEGGRGWVKNDTDEARETRTAPGSVP